MGIRAERNHIFNYTTVYENTKFYHGNNSFRFSGNLEKWEEIEILSRIFYKKLERLLYGNEVTEIMYDDSIRKVLQENDLLDLTLFDVIKKKEYQIETLNTVLMKIFDFVYFTVKKNLPYTKQLSLIANAVSELLENTYKYTSKEYCITTALLEEEKYPLVIKIENKYDDIHSDKIAENLSHLRKGIEEINQYESPELAYFEIMKDRLENTIDNNGDEKKTSRLGFAKIMADTKANITFLQESKQFGEHGITILLSIPIHLLPIEEILKTIHKSLGKE